MSYTIQVENISTKFSADEGTWYNLTWNAIAKNENLLEETYENEGYNYEEEASFFDTYLEIENSYIPMYNYFHVLQRKPNEQEILKIQKNAPNVVIVRDDTETYYIALKSVGCDYSEEIAYAYMIIDSEIPKSFSVSKKHNYYLSDEAHKELVEFMYS